MSVNSDKQNDPDPVYVLRSGSVNVTSLKFCLLDEKDLLLAGYVLSFMFCFLFQRVFSTDAINDRVVLFFKQMSHNYPQGHHNHQISKHMRIMRFLVLFSFDFYRTIIFWSTSLGTKLE